MDPKEILRSTESSKDDVPIKHESVEKKNDLYFLSAIHEDLCEVKALLARLISQGKPSPRAKKG